MMKNFKNEAYKIRMTPEEKAAMRQRIFGMPVHSPVRSPYFIFSFQFSRVVVPLSVVLVVLVGSGTAYAAQGALPGSPLYAVKINIDEPVRIALATTPEAKAAVNAAIAQSRLEEAQELEAQGRLDATTTQELERNFDEHASRALAFIASTTAALAVTQSLENSPPGTSPATQQAKRAVRTSATFNQEQAESFTAPVATTNEAEKSTSNNIEDIPASLQHQRQLLQEIHQRVESHDRGGSGSD
jgi:hypothetical protein